MLRVADDIVVATRNCPEADRDLCLAIVGSKAEEKYGIGKGQMSVRTIQTAIEKTSEEIADCQTAKSKT